MCPGHARAIIIRMQSMAEQWRLEKHCPGRRPVVQPAAPRLKADVKELCQQRMAIEVVQSRHHEYADRYGDKIAPARSTAAVQRLEAKKVRVAVRLRYTVATQRLKAIETQARAATADRG
jgi:hypothetical protein